MNTTEPLSSPKSCACGTLCTHACRAASPLLHFLISRAQAHTSILCTDKCMLQTRSLLSPDRRRGLYFQCEHEHSISRCPPVPAPLLTSAVTSPGFKATFYFQCGLLIYIGHLNDFFLKKIHNYYSVFRVLYCFRCLQFWYKRLETNVK